MGFWDKEKEVTDFKVLTLLDVGKATKEARRWSITYANGNSKIYANMYIVQWRRQYRKMFNPKRLAMDGFLPETTVMRRANIAGVKLWLNANGTPPKYVVSVFMHDENKNTTIVYIDAAGAEQTITNTTASFPQNFWIEGSVFMTPIITLKQNDIIVQKDEHKLTQVLKKMGLSGEEFWTQLEYTCKNYTYPPDGIKDDPTTPDDESNPSWCPPANREVSKIDNAYVLAGLYPGAKDMGAIAGLFETFKLLSGSGGDFAMSAKSLYTNYSWKSKMYITKGRLTDIMGNPLRVGDYKMDNVSKQVASTKPKTQMPGGVSVPTGTGGNTHGNMNNITGGVSGGATNRYSKQLTETTYESIEISGYKQEYGIVRHGKHYVFKTGITSQDDGEEMPRLMIPIEVWNKLKFRHWTGMYESSMCMAVFAYDKVKLKWYQRGIFKVIMFIVMIVVTVFFPPGGAAINITMQTVINAVVNAAISMVVGMIVAQLSPELAMLVGIVMFIWGAGGGLDFDVSNLMSFDNFLPMANQAINTYNKVVEMNIKSAMETEKAELEKIKEENESVVEMLENSAGPALTLTIGKFDMLEAATSPNGVIDYDMFFKQQYGDGIYDFEALFDIDGAVDKRKDVKAG